MYTVIVVGLPELAIWLVAGLVIEAIAIGILAYLVLRTSCVVERVQHSHEQDIEALWRAHEPEASPTQPPKNSRGGVGSREGVTSDEQPTI